MPQSLRTDRGTTGCVQFSGLFQDPLLEEPPTASAPAGARGRHAQLERQARSLCRACPLMSRCLYEAVVDHDVSGFVAGSTRRQRLELRRRLALTVEPEDFDSLAGVPRQHRQVDHAEVVRLRAANPHESLDQLAQRLGCSLSTVKRHLRSERRTPGDPAREQQPRPTQAQVLAAYLELTGLSGGPAYPGAAYEQPTTYAQAATFEAPAYEPRPGGGEVSDAA